MQLGNTATGSAQPVGGARNPAVKVGATPHIRTNCFHLTPRPPLAESQPALPRTMDKRGFTTWLLQVQPQKMTPPYWRPTVKVFSGTSQTRCVFSLARGTPVFRFNPSVISHHGSSMRVAAGSPDEEHYSPAAGKSFEGCVEYFSTHPLHCGHQSRLQRCVYLTV